MSIFEFDDYRVFLQAWRKQLPKKGWGIVSQLASHLRVSQVQVSQVLSGRKDLSLEQALLVAEFLKLSDPETEYLIWLVVKSRSGTDKLSKFSSGRLKNIQRISKELKRHLPADITLTETQSQTFYSSFHYSAIRLFCSIGEGKTLKEVCAHFQISTSRASRIMGFLVSAGLLKDGGSGRYVLGARRTFVNRDSPYFMRHLVNWRLLGLQSISEVDHSDIVFTSPVSLSRKDFEKIQHRLTQIIAEISEQVKNSPAEMVVCWNFDWFELRP